MQTFRERVTESRSTMKAPVYNTQSVIGTNTYTNTWGSNIKAQLFPTAVVLFAYLLTFAVHTYIFQALHDPRLQNSVFAKRPVN